MKQLNLILPEEVIELEKKRINLKRLGFYEVKFILMYETEKAFICNKKYKKVFVIPKSICRNVIKITDEEDNIYIELPKWFCKKELNCYQ